MHQSHTYIQPRRLLTTTALFDLTHVFVRKSIPQIPSKQGYKEACLHLGFALIETELPSTSSHRWGSDIANYAGCCHSKHAPFSSSSSRHSAALHLCRIRAFLSKVRFQFPPLPASLVLPERGMVPPSLSSSAATYFDVSLSSSILAYSSDLYHIQLVQVSCTRNGSNSVCAGTDKRRDGSSGSVSVSLAVEESTEHPRNPPVKCLSRDRLIFRPVFFAPSHGPIAVRFQHRYPNRERILLVPSPLESPA